MSWKILKGDKLSPLHYLKNFTEEEGRNILEAECTTVSRSNGPRNDAGRLCRGF